MSRDRNDMESILDALGEVGMGVPVADSAALAAMRRGVNDLYRQDVIDAGRVVSAARVLLDALRYQPGQTPDVRDAVSMLGRALDRHDTADPALRRAAGRVEQAEG